MQLDTIVYRVFMPAAVRLPIEAIMNEQAQTARSAPPPFNPLAPEFIRDPYPFYERLRADEAMHLSPFGAFPASRHAEAGLVLRDKRCGKDLIDRTIPRYGLNIMDEPVVRRLRRW